MVHVIARCLQRDLENYAGRGGRVETSRLRSELGFPKVSANVFLRLEMHRESLFPRVQLYLDLILDIRAKEKISNINRSIDGRSMRLVILALNDNHLTDSSIDRDDRAIKDQYP